MLHCTLIFKGLTMICVYKVKCMLFVVHTASIGDSTKIKSRIRTVPHSVAVARRSNIG